MMQAQIAIELLEIKPEEAVQDVEEEEVSDGRLDVPVLSCPVLSCPMCLPTSHSILLSPSLSPFINS
jgi:hypothetical protein